MKILLFHTTFNLAQSWVLFPSVWSWYHMWALLILESMPKSLLLSYSTHDQSSDLIALINFHLMTLLFFICVLRSKQPVTLVRKHFPLSSGLLELEASLDNHLYSHGDEIMIDVNVRNNSDKTVKRISAVVLQQVDIAMFKGMHVLICG